MSGLSALDELDYENFDMDRAAVDHAYRRRVIDRLRRDVRAPGNRPQQHSFFYDPSSNEDE